MKKILIGLVITGILISACGGLSAEETASTLAAQTVQAQQRTDFVQQSIQDTVAAAEAAYTLTPTFTLTFTPEPTFTETPIPSPTIIPMVEVTVETATIWTGPGIAFPSLMTAKKGDTFEVYGRSADGSWVVVLVDEVRTKGWISISDVKIGGDISGFIVIQSPPTPTVPTAPPSTTVTVSIINNSSHKFYFNISTRGPVTNIKVATLKAGEQITFEVPKGEFWVKLIFYISGSTACYDWFTFYNDILWVITDANNCKNNPFW